MFFFSKNHYHSIVVKILPSFRSTGGMLQKGTQFCFSGIVCLVCKIFDLQTQTTAKLNVAHFKVVRMYLIELN